MLKIQNYEQLNEFIIKNNIDDIFSINMRSFMELHLFMKNEYIYRSHEKINFLYFLVSGKAKVFATLSNGKSLLSCFYKPFNVLGDIEFTYSENALCNVQAIEDSYLIGISYDKLKQLAMEDIKFLKFMGSCLRDKLTDLNHNTPISLLYPLKSRLSSYILASISIEEFQEKNSIFFDGNLGEVADLLGVSYRHLLRTLKELCEKGAIKKNNDYYEVLDVSLLQRLSGDLECEYNIRKYLH